MTGQTVLNRYRVLRLLGEGAMGQVYLAQQLDQDRQVVVKVLHQHLASDPKFRELFRREVEFMTGFRHRHIVQVYEVDLESPAGACIVMEYVPGVSLEDLLRERGRLDPLHVGRLLGQLCSGLYAAHTRGVIHRDLKPANLLITDPDTARETLKILDFGLARSAGGVHVSLERLQEPGMVVTAGTPAYISPEQLSGGEVDHRADLYSVGILLYELLTGRRPFPDEPLQELIRSQIHELPPPFAPLGLARPVPREVERVVMDCLSKYPRERPADAHDLARRYGHAIGVNILPVEESPPADEGLPSIAAPPAPKKPEWADDPGALVYPLEAWMTEGIAAMKLKGFIESVHGEPLASQPGVIRVRLKRSSESITSGGGGILAWFGFGRPKTTSTARYLQLSIYLAKRDPASKSNQLNIDAVFQTPGTAPVENDVELRNFCDKIAAELCGYLMAKKRS